MIIHCIGNILSSKYYNCVEIERNKIGNILWSFAGFARLWGYPVGILGNNGVLFSESALKVGKIRLKLWNLLPVKYYMQTY